MLTHKGTQEIRTKRLILRKFKPEDAHEMYHNWAKDERVCKFLTWAPHESEEATKGLLNIWCKDYEKSDWYQWAIVYGNKVIGSISVVEFLENNNSAELGYCIGFDYWGKGIMSESVQAVINFLFLEVGLDRITICHALKNPASGRVAQKCGLILEDVHKKEFKSQWGEFLDMAHYAIVRKDYEKIKK
ncbi:MAG: GNAT family N-acetyltransferase [Ruminococcus sp.]|nr:GNAT family N-acetyltransferase [Ruminococcus sp.]